MATRIRLRRGLASDWTAVNPILTVGEPGFERDTRMLKLGDGITAWNDLPYFATGGSTPGVDITRAFPFAFDTPGLLTGHAVYTPTIGDIFKDAWIEIGTAWDGTTPLGDFGDFGLFNLGLLAHINAPVDMTIQDASGLGSIWEAPLLAQPGGTQPSSMLSAFLKVNTRTRGLPVKFTTADPIMVCVSQNGRNNGADPGSTQGEAILYLVTCTPV